MWELKEIMHVMYIVSNSQHSLNIIYYCHWFVKFLRENLIFMGKNQKWEYSESIQRKNFVAIIVLVK